LQLTQRMKSPPVAAACRYRRGDILAIGASLVRVRLVGPA
jgi:hypothetical protein